MWFIWQIASILGVDEEIRLPEIDFVEPIKPARVSQSIRWALKPIEAGSIEIN